MPVYVSAAVAATVLLVVGAVFHVLQSHARNPAERRTALLTTSALAVWAAMLVGLGARGVFAPTVGESVPPVGIALVAALVVWGAALWRSRSLAVILARAQPSLVKLHQWRLLGGVFLVLMIDDQLPALFAVPAALGDIAIAVTASAVAGALARGSSKLVRGWHAFGVFDLVLAVALGVTTSPGAGRLFHTEPSSAAITSFPLLLVPTFLVPVALILHFVSLRLLGSGSRAEREAGVHAGGGAARTPT